MKSVIQTTLFSLIIFFISSCELKKDEVKPTPIVKVENFITTIDERPLNGSSLGFIKATVSTNETLNYAFASGESMLKIDINLESGEITVLDSSYFDYNKNKTIETTVAAFIKSNSDIFDTAHVTIHLNKVESKLNIQQRLTK